MRIPPTADINTQAAFKELHQRIDQLESILRDTARPKDVGRMVDSAKAELHRLIRKPQTLDFNDIYRPAGPAHMYGHVPDPGEFAPLSGSEAVLLEDGTWGEPFGGQIQLVQPTDNGTPIINVLGSLGVNAGLSADSVLARTGMVAEDLSVGGKHGRGMTVLYSRESDVVGAAGETTAATVNIDASKYMANNGDRIIIEQWCKITQVTWTMKSYYGSQAITTWTDIGYGGQTFIFRVTTSIARTGASSQILRSQVSAYSTGAGTSVHYAPAAVTGAISNSGIVNIKTTLTDAGADVTENGAYIYALSAV